MTSYRICLNKKGGIKGYSFAFALIGGKVEAKKVGPVSLQTVVIHIPPLLETSPHHHFMVSESDLTFKICSCDFSTLQKLENKRDSQGFYVFSLGFWRIFLNKWHHQNPKFRAKICQRFLRSGSCKRSKVIAVNSWSTIPQRRKASKKRTQLFHLKSSKESPPVSGNKKNTRETWNELNFDPGSGCFF